MGCVLLSGSASQAARQSKSLGLHVHLLLFAFLSCALIYTYNICTIHIQTDRFRSRHTSTMTSARSRDSADVTTLHGRQRRASSNSWGEWAGQGWEGQSGAIASSTTPFCNTRSRNPYRVPRAAPPFRLYVGCCSRSPLPRLPLDTSRLHAFSPHAGLSGSLLVWLGGSLDDPAEGSILNMDRPTSGSRKRAGKYNTQKLQPRNRRCPVHRVDREGGAAPSSRARAVESLPKIASSLVNFVPALAVPGLRPDKSYELTTSGRVRGLRGGQNQQSGQKKKETDHCQASQFPLV